MSMMILALAAVVQQATPGAILLDRNRVDRAPTTARPPVAAPPKAPASVAAAGSSVPIAGIRFAGARAPAAGRARRRHSSGSRRAARR